MFKLAIKKKAGAENEHHRKSGNRGVIAKTKKCDEIIEKDHEINIQG